MTILFWLLLALLIYCYFGYPCLVTVWARLFAQPVAKRDIVPSVSIVISVYNEEDVIVRKIENLAALDYPSEKIEILIGSDGSTDHTNTLIQALHHPRLRLFVHAGRRGKMATVSELVTEAKGEIIFFNDARQLLAADALRQLVANFADPKVGCASGELIFSSPSSQTARGVDLYWKYEKFIRDQESQLHSMLGATGAIYAIRRHLFIPGPPQVVLDDMFIPLKIVQRGFRAVFDGQAHAYDVAAQNPKEEYSRKARTLFGNYQIFSLLPGLFNPFTSPVAVQLFSHKFLRLWAPFGMIALLLVNLALIHHAPYHMVFNAQIIFYGTAVLGFLARERKYGILGAVARIGYVPYVFCLLNWAALAGFFRFLNARQEITWQKARHV